MSEENLSEENLGEESPSEEQQHVDNGLLKKVIEGALLASSSPLSLKKLGELFAASASGELELEKSELQPSAEDIVQALQEIKASCDGRGFELKEVGSGWRFQVVQEASPWVGRLWEEKPQKYSRALLETLSLIAYRQPITRGDIEAIRGVAVSTNIIKTLMEREWVKVVGHRDVPGRPALYATTREFLDYFNLKSLDELPTLKEIQDLDSLEDGLKLTDEEQAEGDSEASEVTTEAVEAEAGEDGEQEALADEQEPQSASAEEVQEVLEENAELPPGETTH